jgi:hypothetical protein
MTLPSMVEYLEWSEVARGKSTTNTDQNGRTSLDESVFVACQGAFSGVIRRTGQLA